MEQLVFASGCYFVHYQINFFQMRLDEHLIKRRKVGARFGLVVFNGDVLTKTPWFLFDIKKNCFYNVSNISELSSPPPQLFLPFQVLCKNNNL